MILDNDTKQLILLFNMVFGDEFNVVLRSVTYEPEYLPSTSDGIPNMINFANGYFNSALHEIAHWVIAGSSRRKLADYGYWYAQDGRNQFQQQQFQKVEVYPQAIEKAFCEAIGCDFNASIDNLDNPLSSVEIKKFETAIETKKQQLQQQGFPPRAQRFLDALSKQFNYA